MDTITLLIVASLVLGLIFNAMKLMRFIGFVAGAGRRSSPRGRDFDDVQSFDQRLADRLRELDRDRK